MRRLTVLGMALLLAACFPKMEQPEIRLAGARVASIGLSGGVLDVQLSVFNPNRFPLRASGLTYDVELQDPGDGDWLRFTDGRIGDLEVAAGDTALVVVPVEFDYRGIGRVLRGLLERGAFEYRVSGVVALDGPVRRDIRYRHAGTVTSDDIR